MNKAEIMVELLRIAATCVSPSVNDRAEAVAQMAKEWYKCCTDDTLASGSEAPDAINPRRRVTHQQKTVI